MFDMTDKGTGGMHPQDTPEYVDITVTVKGEFIEKAEFSCYDDDLLTECAKTVCEVITDKPYADIFQMNNNAVYYNIPCDLPRNKLYLATIAVMAAKKAVKNYAENNNITLALPDDGCTCI